MSPAPTRRGSLKPSGKNIKKGICQNHKYYNPDNGETGDCPKCASGEVQFVNVQRLSDFKCEVCGSKLQPVTDGPDKKKIAIIVAAIALVIAAVLYFMGVFTSKEEEKEFQQQQAIEQVADSLNVDSAVTEEPAEETPVVEEPKAEPEVKKPGNEAGNGGATTQPKPQPAAKSILGGAATLITENGATTVKFNRAYTLDLGKSDGSTLQINPGDVIERAQIHNNTLRGGNFHPVSGADQYLKGLNVRL